MNCSNALAALAAVLLASTLGACTSPGAAGTRPASAPEKARAPASAPEAAIKDIYADPDAYLRDHFDPARLPARALVPDGSSAEPPVPPRFGKARVTYRVAYDDAEHTPEVVAVIDYRGLAGGYVASRSEYARNAVPYRANFLLTFGGVFVLKSQTVFLERSNAEPPYSVRSTYRMDRGVVAPVSGGEYRFEASGTDAPQAAGPAPWRYDCKAGEKVRASTIHPALSGDAVAIDCAFSGSNLVVQRHEKSYMLVDYGFALQREYADTRRKATFSVQDVRIER